MIKPLEIMIRNKYLTLPRPKDNQEVLLADLNGNVFNAIFVNRWDAFVMHGGGLIHLDLMGGSTCGLNLLKLL